MVRRERKVPCWTQTRDIISIPLSYQDAPDCIYIYCTLYIESDELTSMTTKTEADVIGYIEVSGVKSTQRLKFRTKTNVT